MNNTGHFKVFAYFFALNLICYTKRWTLFLLKLPNDLLTIERTKIFCSIIILIIIFSPCNTDVLSDRGTLVA